MKDVTDKNFGVIIAFWLPGFLLLWGLSYSSPDLAVWLARASTDPGPTVGGFLFATLASLAVGLMISAVRWAIVDQMLYRVTRLPKPAIDYGKLAQEHVLAAFQGAIENNYRYYQYYANTFVAVVAAAAAAWVHERGALSVTSWIGIAAVALILFLAARNELAKFNQRAEQITR